MTQHKKFHCVEFYGLKLERIFFWLCYT